MKLLLTILLNVFSVLFAQQCGPNNPYMYCYVRAVYIIDTTSNLPNITIDQSFDYMRNYVIASTGWGTQEISFMSYGTGLTSTNPFTTDASSACTMVNVLQMAHNLQGSESVSLVQVMQSYKVAYYHESDIGSPVILFSASKDQKDIDAAGVFIQQNLGNVNFTVVALGGVASYFENFPAVNVFDMLDISDPPHAITYCLAREACGQNGYCNTNTLPPNLTTPHKPTTSMGTTKVATTPRATTQQATTQPAPTQPAAGPIGCGPCNYGQVWNDVIYLVDASEAAGSKSFGDMIGLIQSNSFFYNIQKTGSQTNYSMQVGLITYASTAQLVAPLGSIDGDDLFNLNPSYRAGDSGTNIEAAISMAINQFDSSSHRTSSRKVIVLMATTYNPGSYNAPQKAAETFIEDGGVLIVYDYVPNHGEPSTELREIASPGYFIYSPDSNSTSLPDAQCDANCFCPPNFQSFVNSARQTPQEGCYYAVDIQTNFQLAKRNCMRNYNNGTIAADKTASKSTFLKKGFNQPTSYYIGLTYDTYKRTWVWEDGAELSGNYQPWLNGHTPSSDANGGCVYVSQATDQWIQTDCRYGYYYTCQATPCASTKYCPLQQL